MKVSVTQAAKLADKSRTTLYSAMDNGELSFEKKGKSRVIDVSELMRVYGPLDIEDSELTSSGVKTEQKKTKPEQKLDSTGIEHFRIQLEKEQSEREREREQYVSEIEHLRERLEEADDQLKEERTERRKLTAMLTDQRSNAEKENETVRDQNERVDALNNEIKKLQLQNKKILSDMNRSWIQKFFGRKKAG